MPEETLKYRIELDEGSLMSEMARARGTISGALQQGIGTGQYAYNNIQADMSMAQRAIAGPPAMPLASPTSELGFFRSMIAAAGAPPPNNMLTYDYQRLGQMEFQSRLFDTTSAIGRQAIPMAIGFTANAILGGGAKGLIADIGATAIAAPVVSAVYDRLQQKNDADIMLNIVRAPNAMRQFTKAERGQLTGGLLEDVARDIRFGADDLNKLLAGAQVTGTLEGATDVEDFRKRFRGMVDQVKNITRIFQQTTEEAIGTIKQMNSMGIETRPGEMQGFITGINALKRFSNLSPNEAMQISMQGAQTAAAQGAPMAQGRDVGNRYAMLANAAINTNIIDANTARQMGGVAGIASFQQQADIQLAQTRPIIEMLAGMANEGMTDIDPNAINRVISGQVDFQDLIEKRGERLANPEQSQLFKANMRKMQNTVVASGQTTKLLREYAKFLAPQRGIPVETQLGVFLKEAGLDPMQQQVELDLLRNSGQLEPLVDKQRDASAMELAFEKQREEGRFTNIASRWIGERMAGLTNSVGTPIGKAASFAADWSIPVLGAASGFFTMGIGWAATAGYEAWKHRADIDLWAGSFFGGGMPKEGVATDGGSRKSSYQALKDLSDGDMSKVGDGAMRDRVSVSKMAIDRGFLNSNTMSLTDKELSTLKKHTDSKGQRSFIEELEKIAMGSEGHRVSADQIFGLIGKGTGQYPSSTPSAGSGLDKWDHVAITLDQLRGATDNLRVASEALMRSTQSEKVRSAGKN